MTEHRLYTYQSARSGSLVAGITIAVAIETVAVHLVLRIRHPAVAWSLTGLSILTIAWLVRDYMALRRRSPSS